MAINENVLTVQPGDDRATANVTPQEQVSFDLGIPDTAPDEWKRAAARRISESIGVPDPDGRVWRRDKGAFATGHEYLGFMRDMIHNGNIWDYAATQELKDFEKADDAGKIALARSSQRTIEKVGNSAARILAPEGYGLEDTDPRLTGATADVLAANARLRGDEESRRRYNLEQTAASQPFVPRDTQTVKADTDAIDAWRKKRDDTALIDAHRETLMRDNLWAVSLAVFPSLSEKGKSIAANVFKNRKLSGAHIADFQQLPEKDQAVIAKLARLSRNPVQGTFFNALGDAGVGFLNGILQLPVNAGKQIGTLTTSIDQAIFGKNAGLIDAEEMNRRARTEQRLMEAIDDPAGINPSGAEHGYIARSLIGAVSTLPYMAYASAGGIGVTAVALDFMQRLDDRIAQDGGDVYGHNPSWIAQKAIYGAIYSGIEKVSALPIFKETSDIALKTMFLKLATRHGLAAAEKLALHVGKETFTETLQEAAQRMIEEHAASVGLNRGPGWQEAIKGGIDEFAETLGTMGLIALTGSARQGIQVRTLRGRQELSDFTVDTMRREIFLLNDNDNITLSSEQQLNDYRTAWESGGIEALQKRPGLTPQQSSILANIFEGELYAKEVGELITGRNIINNTEGGHQSAGLGEDDIRQIVRTAGPDAASRLQEIGFTESGASRIVEFFAKESEYNASYRQIISDIRTAVMKDRTQPDAESSHIDEARELAERIQPLRSLYQLAGTRDGAVKAYQEIGFSEEQSKRMADAFHNEHELATSPQTAAAFRAFYLDTSDELTVAERLQHMTGFESTPAPEYGEGAVLLSIRDKNGDISGRIVYQPNQNTAFDPESDNAGEAIEQVTGGLITAAEWKTLTSEQRKDFSQRMGIRANGGFSITSMADPSVNATGTQADILTGRMATGENAPSATLYHEATHAWLAVMRHAGKITPSDIKKLQDKYGIAADDPGWFNEEALADDIREIGAASDFTPEKTLASRFISAVRRFAGSTRQVEAQRKAASGARQALYENIVYGSEFTGVGEFERLTTKSKKTEAPPTAGASTAVPENKGTEQNSTDDKKETVKKDDSSVPEKGDEKKNGTKKSNSRVDWTAATPQGNLRVGGYWLIAPRDKFISDTDPRYDFSLQGRSRDATSASAEQVAGISAAGEFDPLRLMDAPDTSSGAPVVVPVTIKGETFYMVLSGNGRFRALDAVDADHRGDTYRNPIRLFADDKGISYDPADMTEAAKPRLVRVLMKRPAGITLQEIAARSNQNTVLQMTDAEQATSDAELIDRDGTAMLFNANKDGLPSKTGSDEFFAWFVRATGDASLSDSKGRPTDTARSRARRAMLALVIGRGTSGKDIVMAFTENAESLGLDRQRDALLMSAGIISALEDSKPVYGLSEDLSRASAAMLQISRDRKAGKNTTAEEFISQGDMINPMPTSAADTLRLLDSPRPPEHIAEALRRYSELASRIDTDTPDMFGEPPAAKDMLLRKAIEDTEGIGSTRYSIAARRYALATGMPKGGEGEKLIEKQLEFIFARQYDSEYLRKQADAAKKRKATRDANIAAKERARLGNVRDTARRAFINPEDPDTWNEAFDSGSGTVSQIVHQFFTGINEPQRFPGAFNGRPIVGLKVKTASDFAALLMPLRNPYVESVKAIYIDANDHIVGADVCTVGILNTTQVHPRELFNRAIKLDASKVVFSHNHPSGDPTPSSEDRLIKERLDQVGNILGIKQVDHIITNGKKFYSLKDDKMHSVTDAQTPDWEAVPAGETARITSPQDMSRLVNVLRQSKGDFIHAVFLGTKNNITAVTRIPFDATKISNQDYINNVIVGAVVRAAVSEPTNSMLLDLTSSYITPNTAIKIHNALGLSESIIGIKVLDSIYNDSGWARSVQQHEALIMPLTFNADAAAEKTGTRYSLSATLDGLNEKIAREMEEVWNKYHNPDGSEKQSWMATPDESDTILTEKQWMMVRTDSFKAWFGDWENDPENSSKAVGENGEPMIFYHGTGPEFWSFDKSKLGSRENMFFFSSNPSIARDYGTRVMQVFLNMRNPYEGGLLSRKDVIARGHDGFIFDKDEPHNEWAVLHPGQIKSSTNSTGGFNSSNDDIRYSLKANVDRLMTMPPVDNIDVNTFQKSDTDLVTQVAQFFAEKHPDGIERENLGHVALTRRGVKSSIAHGIGQRKAAAFAAVPSVVQNGIEIDRQENWKGRGYDSSVIAAPVNIGDVQYIAEIILTADHRTGDWMFYLHEVEEKEKLRSAFKTGMNTGAPRSSRLILAKMLSQVNSAKTISDRLLRRELIDAGIMTDENYAELTTRPRTRAEHTRDGSNELVTHRFRILDWIRTHGYNVEENEADGTYTVTADKSDEPSSEAQEPIRYALDMTGKAYDKKDLLVGFMAHAAMTGASFPSKNTIARMAESIGVESFNYESLAASAKRLAELTEDSAIRKAAISNDPNKAAYAIGELSRHAARAYVRSGAKEGERLARDADRIHNLSEAGVRRAMAALTGAAIADIETDTDIDIAASILAADPKKFHPRRENEKAQTDEQGLQPLSSADRSADATAFDETDEESPELTDKQRADIARKRKEREARVQAYLDAARKRGTKNRLWDEKRRAEKEKSVANPEETPPASGSGDGASGLQLESTESIPEFDTLPIDFSDRWEAAALLRVWAFDRFRRDNPNRKGENRDLTKDRVAVEFFRKTAIRQLKDLARKLLEPGAPRETVISLVGDITEHLTANQIERRTAYIFGLINRHAVREERRELVKKFRAEIKRQFIKGEKFEELGVDLGRTLTGAVEEDARYVMRVCELSDRVLDGETSALQKERERLNGIISERENMTAEDGSPLPAGANDIQTRMALRQLALLDKFGGMIDMMPGEILDLSGSALADFAQEALALRQRWDSYDKLVKSILEPLAVAITRGEKDPQSIETKAGAITDSLTGMLRLRLDFLTRYADPETRKAARTAINDFMDLLARGNTDFTISLQEDEAALNRALGEIFTRQDGSPDRTRIRAYLRRLDQKIPNELALQLSRQGHQNNMTYGQMLNLLGYLDQWASYKNNIIKHERQGQAALIRSFVFENPETGNVDPVLTAEDTQVLEWLRRQFYANKRDKITAVTERLAGRSVDSPDPLYMPATMLQEKRKGLHVGQGAWQPLAGVFSRRVRNNLDVDERASILDVFHDRSRETALLMAFSERGMIIREILTSRSLQDVIKRYHGDASLTRILKQVEQTLNGGRPKTQTDAQANAAALAMRVTTYIGLGWNVQSAAKQTASLPIFANVIGTRKLWQIMLSAPDPESIRKLRESDEYRVRYGTGPASGMDIATRAAYDSPNDSAFKRFFADWGLWANRKADWVISAWIGQGIYRDFKAKYLDQGMSEQDAERRAISETFSVIEETQQSGRTENATALTREHGLLGKLLTQFATSPLQQMQYEITSFREWRDLAENNGNPENIREARNRFVRATMINHIIVPGLMTAVTSLYKAVTGGEPDWKKDGFWWTLFIAAIMGQFGRIFFAGALTEQTLRTLLLREPPRMGQLVPAEGAIRFTATLAYPIRDVVTWDEKHFADDIRRVLKSIALTRLPTSMYENYMKDDK